MKVKSLENVSELRARRPSTSVTPQVEPAKLFQSDIVDTAQEMNSVSIDPGRTKTPQYFVQRVLPSEMSHSQSGMSAKPTLVRPDKKIRKISSKILLPTLNVSPSVMARKPD